MGFEHIDSYYSRTLNNPKTWPPLTGNADVRVAIVGGGLAGINTALGLVDRGVKDVVVLEANRMGWGASGRNGGFMSPGFALDMLSVEKRVGLPHAQKLYAKSLAAQKLVCDRMKASKISCEAVDGLVEASIFNDIDDVADYVSQMNDKFDAGYDLWPVEKVRSQFKSNRYYAGYLRTKSFHMHTLNYLKALVDSLATKGVSIYEQTPVTDMRQRADGRWELVTPQGAVVADHVVMCCSAYVGGLNGRLQRGILPVATYIMLTEKLGPRLKDAIDSPYAFSDLRFACDYYRVVDGDRILWGGDISVFNLSPDQVAKAMMKRLKGIYPQLGDIQVDTAWTGMMGYPTHRMPQVGSMGGGLWYNTGFGGHGLNATTVGGEAIAGAIAQGDETYRLFEPFGLDYTGWPFGQALVQMGYWWFQVQDTARGIKTRLTAA